MTVGQQYLTSLRESAMRQRERQSKARALSVQMHRMFLPIAEEITCKRTDSGKMLLDIAHLIDNKTVERYQNKYSSATQELKECRMQLSGPVASVSLCAPHQPAASRLTSSPAWSHTPPPPGGYTPKLLKISVLWISVVRSPH